MKLLGPINTGAAAGGAGVATATVETTQPSSGILLGMYVRYNDSPPATTDVVISTSGNYGMPSYDILTLSNSTTDGFFLVRHNVYDETGAQYAAEYESVPIHDTLTVTIDQANDGDSVDVWFLIE